LRPADADRIARAQQHYGNGAGELHQDWDDPAQIEKVVQLISTDKTKTQFYCELAKINEQIGQEKTKDYATIKRLENRADDLEEEIGPEFVEFMDALDDADESTLEGKELVAALDKLDDLCPRNSN
jgi:hypothetical protein